MLTRHEVGEALAYLRAVHALLDWAPERLAPRHTSYRVGSQGGRVERYFGVTKRGKKLETFSEGSGASE